jgi:hypothetical protein
MLQDLDPNVKAAIRRITNRFIRLRKGNPPHEVRVKLGSNRHDLDPLVQERVLDQTVDTYRPRLRALDLEDEQTREFCYRYTDGEQEANIADQVLEIVIRDLKNTPSSGGH